MLKSAGCKYVIIGHSERREYQKEKSKELNLKSLFEKDVSPKTIKKSRSIKRHVSPFVSNSNFLFPSIELLEKPKKNPSINYHDLSLSGYLL